MCGLYLACNGKFSRLSTLLICILFADEAERLVQATVLVTSTNLFFLLL